MGKGRPRKAGKREANGRLQRRGLELRPAWMDTPGLARSASDGVEMDVWGDGQVIGRTVRHVTALDRLAIARFPGDPGITAEQHRALVAYRDAHDRAQYPQRSGLNDEPGGGGGMEALVDAHLKAGAHYRRLVACLTPYHCVTLDCVALQGMTPVQLADEIGGDEAVVYASLARAADLLAVALTR